LPSALDEMGGQRHAPTSLLLGKTQYAWYKRLGGPQGLSECAENLAPTGIQTLDLQSVMSRYIDYAILTHVVHYVQQKFKTDNPVV